MNIRKARTLTPAIAVISVSVFAAFLPFVLKFDAGQISYLTLLILAITIPIISYQIHIVRRPRHSANSSFPTSLGLTGATRDSSKYDYEKLFQNSRDLVICLNDGRTWLSTHRELLRERLQDHRVSTTVILCHPESSFLNTLAKKGSTEVKAIQEKIRESVEIIDSVKTKDSNVEVLGHFLFNPSSIVIGDDTAIVTPYYFSRGGRKVPSLVFSDGENSDYLSEIKQDLERLRIDSKRLDYAKRRNLEVV